jgi:hypothetical protein|tara:strand:+ start:545 stop:934 length:390 start_codon:yes stop_codon:yes gene_type:complete
MNEGKAIYSILTTDSAVSAIVSSRVYPQIAAQGAAFPFVVYVINDITPSDTKSGVSTLDEVRYEILAISENYAEAADLNEKIRTALDRYTGTVAEVVIDSIQFTELETDYDTASETYIANSEYIIRVKR